MLLGLTFAYLRLLCLNLFLAELKKVSIIRNYWVGVIRFGGLGTVVVGFCGQSLECTTTADFMNYELH